MIITENGYGAHETLEKTAKSMIKNELHSEIDQIDQLVPAIEDGAKVFGYNPWSLRIY